MCCADGEAFAFGQNNCGQLGVQTCSEEEEETEIRYSDPTSSEATHEYCHCSSVYTMVCMYVYVCIYIKICTLLSKYIRGTKYTLYTDMAGKTDA